MPILPTLPRSFRLAVPALLCLAVSAAAQTAGAPAPAPAAPAAPLPPPGLSAPASPESVPATVPATAPATAAAPATEPAPVVRAPFTTSRPAATLSSKIKFNFKDAQPDTIIDSLATSFGFTVMRDPEVRFTKRVTIYAPGDVTADEAVDLINTAIKDQGTGYGVILNDKILHVTDRTNLKQYANVYTSNKPEEIPKTDTIRTQIIPLFTVDAVRLKQDLSTMFSPDADVSANAASNTLIITDTAARIRRIVEIVASMDQQNVRNSDLLIQKLHNANATAAAKLLTDIFNGETSGAAPAPAGGFGGFGGGRGGGRGGFGGFGGGGGPGGAQAQGQGTGARNSKIIASADDRTNTVVVSGSTETLKAVKNVLEQIDADNMLETTFFVYPLKNANAVNLQGVLNGLFGNSTSSAGSTANNRSNSGFSPLGSTGTTGIGGGRGGAAGGRGGAAGGFGSTGFGATNNTSRTGATSGGLGSSANRGAGTASGDLAGQAFVVAEPDTNSLLVTVKTTQKQNVMELIAKLDRDVPQVLIKVLVCEVTHTNASDIGVEYSVLNQRAVPALNADGTPTTVKGGTTVGTGFGIEQAISTAVASGGPTGLAVSVVEQNLAAALRLLATTGKLDVLSRPSILASDNQLASIMVGQLVPIITASNQTTLGNIVNSVSYQQVGIILNVTPHINPDGLVILDVAPTVSQLSATTVTVSQGVAVPVIDQRQAQTRVAIRNGQTIIIGGLMQDQKTETVDKIPLLGDIPWIGQAFSHTVSSKTKTELLIFLTPQVALSPDLLPGMTADERQATQLVPNAVAPGTFDEHMQGMSRGNAKIRPNEGNMPFQVIPASPPPPQIDTTTPPGRATPAAPPTTMPGNTP